MKIEIEYKYTEGYLPTKRHRKLRHREAKDVMTVHLNTANLEDAPVAFITKEPWEQVVEYRLWMDRLWKRVLWRERHCQKQGLYPFQEFISSIQHAGKHSSLVTKEDSEREKYEYVNQHLIIDGEVYGQTNEPRYVLMTFGLGNNHGGTSLHIETGYNSNVSKHRYFNALQRKEAVEEGKRIAESRGDNESIERIGRHCTIEVILPEAVRCNPQEEHGEGEPFLNRLYAITETKTDARSKGVLALGILATELEKIEKMTE